MPPESVQVNEVDHAAGGTELTVTSPHWRLRVDCGEQLDPYELVHLASGRVVADESYCYRLTVTGVTNSGFHGGPVSCRRVRPLGWSIEHHEDSGATLSLLGGLDFGTRGPTGIRLEHRITLAASGQVIEQIALVNQAGQDQLRLDDVRFGFRKTLFDRGRWAWRPQCERAELVPVPLRRFRAQDVDHLLAGYRARDLFPSEWPGRDSLPDRSSEAWLWAEEDGGFLVAKYAQEHAEFSLADGEHVVARRPAGPVASLQLDQLHSDRNLCLRHSGAGVRDGFPEHAAELGPGQRLSFGTSVIVAYDGDWQAGYASYKNVLRERGHVTPAGYDPQVHWNELYRLGWRCGSNAPLQELRRAVPGGPPGPGGGGPDVLLRPGVGPVRGQLGLGHRAAGADRGLHPPPARRVRAGPGPAPHDPHEVVWGRPGDLPAGGPTGRLTCGSTPRRTPGASCARPRRSGSGRRRSGCSCWPEPGSRSSCSTSSTTGRAGHVSTVTTSR